MDKKRESGEILEHMLLEEVKIENIDYIEPPEEWNPEVHQKEPFVPPVLIREKDPIEEGVDERSEYTLLAHHRSFWRMQARGQFTVRAIVVRSSVHISLAHESIKNCVEEALLFDGLLRNELCENRSRLSELLGYSRARITQILNLLKLPGEMRRKLLLTDEISEFQLRPIVRVSKVKDQKEMFEHLIRGKLTGRQMALFADEKGNGDSDIEIEGMPDLEELMSRERSEGETEPGLSRGEARRVAAVVSPAHVRSLMQMIRLRSDEWRDEALKQGVSRIDMEFLGGVSKLRNGLYREAVRILEDVVEENPDYAPAWFYIGKCCNLTGDLDEAENSLRTALELAPDEPDYLIELAIVLEKMKRENEASTFYRKAGAIRRKTAAGRETN
ncbi:MAG: tetratricopeptide repeat protein [Candidatus Fermentibacteraceae bacterium]|nr:tetratricopeptide repeat protein [Candidatus Fermentibacteraceae bacterium]